MIFNLLKIDCLEADVMYEKANETEKGGFLAFEENIKDIFDIIDQ
jgi:hypothetical protein